MPPGAGEVTSADLATQRGWRPRRAPRDVGACSQNSGQHLLGRLGERVLLLAQVGIPGRGVPDLQAGIGPDHAAVTLQLRVVAQPEPDRDPALPVPYLVGFACTQDPSVVPFRLR